MGSLKDTVISKLNTSNTSFWVIIASVITVLILAIALISNPIKGLSIYEHPETFLDQNSLKVSAKVWMINHITGEEYMLITANEITQVTSIVEDMRISKKKISKNRSNEIDSHYSIRYYADINDSISDYCYTIHIAPVWTDNNIKPSYRFHLINQKDIFKRLQEVFALKRSKTTYDIESLLKNKTQYIGDNSKVVALIDNLPLPEGISRGMVELATSKPPYGITIHYNLNDDSVQIPEERFLRNSIMLFALIDNVEEVTHIGHWTNKLLSSTPFRFTYTRANAERIIGGDVRQFTQNRESLAKLIEIILMLGADNTKIAMKGLELYVWRKPDLTGNNEIYYTLLPGTNRNKIDKEVYDLSIATKNIADINREIISYGDVDIFVSHPASISGEEIDQIMDQIKNDNRSITVSRDWFNSAVPSVFNMIGGTDGPTQIIISPDVSVP